MTISRLSLVVGIIAGVSLLAFYASTMWLLSRSWEAVVLQFKALWWLMVPLSVSFGLQVGLFTNLQRNKGTMVAGGSSAGIGMIACCAHHLVEVFPILGFSALAIFLADYQTQLLALSLIINLVGAGLMFRTYLRQLQTPVLRTA